MAYKKINFSRKEGKDAAENTKILQALKKTCRMLQKEFSIGTDRMADAWTNERARKKDRKSTQVKKELISMVKSIASGAKRILRDDLYQAICDISNELGRGSRKMWDDLREMINDLKG